jgi:predicted nucleic acid-binding protein
MVIVDADVMIEVLRKNPTAATFLRNEIGAFNIVLSAVTIAEIQQGATNKENLQQINRILRQYIILPVEYQISNIFTNLVHKYVLSHNTDIGDTFVAATSLYYQLPLLTMNHKHYKHIPNLQLVKHNIRPMRGGTSLILS